jgi:hypothetical protein
VHNNWLKLVSQSWSRGNQTKMKGSRIHAHRQWERTFWFLFHYVSILFLYVSYKIIPCLHSSTGRIYGNCDAVWTSHCMDCHLSYSTSCGHMRLELSPLHTVSLKINCICMKHRTHYPLGTHGTPNTHFYITNWNSVCKIWISCAPVIVLLCPHTNKTSKMMRSNDCKMCTITVL